MWAWAWAGVLHIIAWLLRRVSPCCSSSLCVAFRVEASVDWVCACPLVCVCVWGGLCSLLCWRSSAPPFTVEPSSACRCGEQQQQHTHTHTGAQVCVLTEEYNVKPPTVHYHDCKVLGHSGVEAAGWGGGDGGCLWLCACTHSQVETSQLCLTSCMASR